MSVYLKKVIANTSWLASEKVMTMLVNLVVNIILARSLGPEGFGILNYLLAIISIVKPLSALGLNGIVTRELVNNPDQEPKIVSTVVGLRFFGAFLGCIVCLLIAWRGWGISSDPEKYGLIALGVASCFGALSVLEFWFQAHMKAKIIVKMRTVVIVFFSVVKLIVVFFYPDIFWVVLAFAVESVFLGLGFIVIYGREKGMMRIKLFDLSYGITLLKQASWLILSGIAAVIYLKIDQIMLEHLASSREVGVYAVAAKLSEVWYFFAEALVVTLFPGLLALRKISHDLYEKRLQVVCDALFVAALLLSIFIMLVGKTVVSLLYGQDYLVSALILQIHIWASIFVFMRALASKWLLAENLLAFSLVSHGVGALFNVVGNWLLIPEYGGIGAAVATVFSYFMASYSAFWLGSKTRPVAVIMTRSLFLPFTLGYRYWPIKN